MKNVEGVYLLFLCTLHRITPTYKTIHHYVGSHYAMFHSLHVTRNKYSIKLTVDCSPGRVIRNFGLNNLKMLNYFWGEFWIIK